MWVAVMSMPTSPEIINKFTEVSDKYGNTKLNEEILKSTYESI